MSTARTRITPRSQTTRVAISLTQDLLDEVDRLASDRGLSRSEVFRRAATRWLRVEAEREAAQRYVAGYRREPETSTDIAQARRSAAAALAAEPWE